MSSSQAEDEINLLLEDNGLDFFNDINQIPQVDLDRKGLESEDFSFLDIPVDELNDIEGGIDQDLDHIEFDSDTYEDLDLDDIVKCKKQTRNEIGNLNNEDLDHGMAGEKLHLTAEEKILLLKAGCRIPTHLPLTKTEDRALRTVRRKIRNKLSAKASRARRQKYLSGLEDKINQCNKDNFKLKNKVSQLEQEKKSLISYVRRLRNFISTHMPDNVGTASSNGNARFGKRKQEKMNQSFLPFYQQQTTLNSSKSYIKPAAGGTSLLVAVFIILAWTAVVPLSEENKFQLDNSSSDIPSRILLSTNKKSIYGPQLESFYEDRLPTAANQHRKTQERAEKMNKTNTFRHIADKKLSLETGSIYMGSIVSVSA